MPELKILTWNIRQGGRKAIREIVASLDAHQADLIILTEYKNNESGRYLIAALKQQGWSYVQSTRPPGRENGVLIMSAYALEACEAPIAHQNGAHRWNEVYIPRLELSLLGVHVPNVGEIYDKQFFWEHIVQYAEQKQDDRTIMIGDFNSVRKDENKAGARQYSDFIMKLLASGWTDAWKAMHPDGIDYSWFSHKQNGFRLDYLFLSPKLATALTACDFTHWERRQNYSDHSALIAHLDVFPAS